MRALIKTRHRIRKVLTDYLYLHIWDGTPSKGFSFPDMKPKIYKEKARITLGERRLTCQLDSGEQDTLTRLGNKMFFGNIRKLDQEAQEKIDGFLKRRKEIDAEEQAYLDERFLALPHMELNEVIQEQLEKQFKDRTDADKELFKARINKALKAMKYPEVQI